MTSKYYLSMVVCHLNKDLLMYNSSQNLCCINIEKSYISGVHQTPSHEIDKGTKLCDNLEILGIVHDTELHESETELLHCEIQ